MHPIRLGMLLALQDDQCGTQPSELFNSEWSGEAVRSDSQRGPFQRSLHVHMFMSPVYEARIGPAGG